LLWAECAYPDGVLNLGMDGSLGETGTKTWLIKETEGGIGMDFVTKESINKGWSSDRKYCVTAEDGTRYCLRISDPAKFKKKQDEFREMKKAASLGIPMCQPIEFGVSEDGVYSLQSWIDGEDAEQEDWEICFGRKIDSRIKAYRECPLQYEGGEALIRYVEQNRHLLQNRPQVYQHGDYHIGNMMIDREGKLQIIDFDRSSYGDPWEEFNRIVWCVQASPTFACGMVDGYFEQEIPMEFWGLLALYIASNTLGSLPWAIPFGQGEVDTMQNQAREVLDWYDGMRTVIPSWYRQAKTHLQRL
jgi:aminoglycoside phosphotransferase (APT) family kinase protein